MESLFLSTIYGSISARRLAAAHWLGREGRKGENTSGEAGGSSRKFPRRGRAGKHNALREAARGAEEESEKQEAHRQEIAIF